MSETMITPAVNIDQIRQAAKILARGGLVAFPTETVYGLGADADDRAAVAAIFAAKGRPADHPVIVHVQSAAAIAAWAADVPPAARHLARAFWPGPLTLVLRRSSRAHDGLTGGQDTVGLRCPAHPWAHALMAAFCTLRGDASAALAAPSANSFSRISPTTAAHVRADLGERPSGSVDLILDGGACPVGIESTILDLSRDRPRLLRPGAVSRAQLEACIGRPVDDAGVDAPRASGRLELHYAPRTRTELVAPEQLARRITALGIQRLALLVPATVVLPAHAVIALRLDADDEPQAFAQHLYADLHRLDASGAERILIATPPAAPAWEAVFDRLRRAACSPDGRDDRA